VGTRHLLCWWGGKISRQWGQEALGMVSLRLAEAGGGGPWGSAAGSVFCLLAVFLFFI